MGTYRVHPGAEERHTIGRQLRRHELHGSPGHQRPGPRFEETGLAVVRPEHRIAVAKIGGREEFVGDVEAREDVGACAYQRVALLVQPQHTHGMEDGQSGACRQRLPVRQRAPGPFGVDLLVAVARPYDTALAARGRPAVSRCDGIDDGDAPAGPVQLPGAPDAEHAGADHHDVELGPLACGRGGPPGRHRRRDAERGEEFQELTASNIYGLRSEEVNCGAARAIASNASNASRPKLPEPPLPSSQFTSASVGSLFRRSSNRSSSASRFTVILSMAAAKLPVRSRRRVSFDSTAVLRASRWSVPGARNSRRRVGTSNTAVSTKVLTAFFVPLTT